MKYGTQASKTTTSGGLDAPQQFSIQNSQIAFETLSSRLYTDPIRAVIRELSCNAYDAHVAAGKKDQPFEVALPTNFDPSFRIRDYGPGMSHEQVLSLYCTYFASDKTNDNSVIGAFGLGSKSPFAYFLRNGKAGGFAVISCHGGKARTYAAFIDNGFPKVELQDERDTVPDNTGLEVIFPVEQRDVWEFENKARIVFEFFDPLPKFNKHMEVSRPEYTIETKRWGLRKSADTEQGAGVRAIMGGVAYTVGNIDVSRLSEAQQQVLGMPLDIFYSIGEVNPAVSRENLQLDARTIDAIKKSLDEVYVEILEQVKKKVDAAPNMWEGKMIIWNMLQHDAIAGIVNAAYNKGQLSGQYANFTLTGTGKDLAVNELDFTSIQVYRYERSWRRRGSQREEMFTLKPEERSAALKSTESGVVERKDYDCKFRVDPEVAFVLDDMKPGRANKFVYAYVQNRASDNSEKRVVYLISPLKDADQKAALAEADGLLAALGNPPITAASALQAKYDYLFPKREYVPRERGVLRFEKPYGSRSWRNAWKAATAEQVNGGGTKLYVVIEGRNREPQDALAASSPRSFASLVEHMKESGLFGMDTGTPVFGLRKNAKLRREHGWTEFRGYVEKAISQEMTPVREASLSLKVHPFQTDWEFALDYIAKHHPLDGGSPLQQFADDLAAAKRALGKSGEHFAAVLNLMGRKATAVDLNEAWAKVKAQYPVIDMFGRRGYGSGNVRETDAFVGYARMIEQAAQKPQGPTKDELRRARKARNQKAYYERKRQAGLAALASHQGNDKFLMVNGVPVLDGAV
jgi:hypothetical protein